MSEADLQMIRELADKKPLHPGEARYALQRLLKYVDFLRESAEDKER